MTDPFVQYILAHELGHFLGLADSNCSTSVMSGYANSNMTQISAEDCAAIADLMLPPPPDPPEDPRHCARESGIDDCKASPILLDLGGTGIWFGGQSDAVLFDVTGDGQLELVNWVRPGGGATFLVRDLDGNGIVDGAGELFGTATVMPDGSLAENGFLALAVLDEAWYGGNGDGKVNASDIGWYSLLVWIDSNANGLTEPGELQPLSAAGVLAIELDYRTLGRRDRHGNLYRYMSFLEPENRGWLLLRGRISPRWRAYSGTRALRRTLEST
ncbi:MAG: matrixin family metalloprotease, partial [Acidobacteriota bacterium]